jgi:hypothetical protein
MKGGWFVCVCTKGLRGIVVYCLNTPRTNSKVSFREIKSDR